VHWLWHLCTYTSAPPLHHFTCAALHLLGMDYPLSISAPPLHLHPHLLCSTSSPTPHLFTGAPAPLHHLWTCTCSLSIHLAPMHHLCNTQHLCTSASALPPCTSCDLCMTCTCTSAPPPLHLFTCAFVHLCTCAPAASAASAASAPPLPHLLL
jgi:hypothetical protein